jgi:hypothetical protein
VTVESGGRAVAQADVVPGGQVVVRFWTTAHSLTDATRPELVRVAFEHAALGPRQPVLASVPQEDSGLISELRSRVAVTASHVAGVTCLIEGRVA